MKKDSLCWSRSLLFCFKLKSESTSRATHKNSPLRSSWNHQLSKTAACANLHLLSEARAHSYRERQALTCRKSSWYLVCTKARITSALERMEGLWGSMAMLTKKLSLNRRFLHKQPSEHLMLEHEKGWTTTLDQKKPSSGFAARRTLFHVWYHARSGAMSAGQVRSATVRDFSPALMAPDITRGTAIFSPRISRMVLFCPG